MRNFLPLSVKKFLKKFERIAKWKKVTIYKLNLNNFRRFFPVMKFEETLKIPHFNELLFFFLGKKKRLKTTLTVTLINYLKQFVENLF